MMRWYRFECWVGYEEKPEFADVVDGAVKEALHADYIDGLVLSRHPEE
jgi:hypothetical protein